MTLIRQDAGTIQSNTLPNVTHLQRYFSYNLSSYKICHISVINKDKKVWFVAFCSIQYHLYDAVTFV